MCKYNLVLDENETNSELPQFLACLVCTVLNKVAAVSACVHWRLMVM